MVTALVVCCGLLSALPPEADADGPAPDLAAYEAAYNDAKAEVGRDADAHVRLALWCEAHGLHAERLKHLAIAALIEPGHVTARGLMGLVAHAGSWKRPDAVADRLKADARLAATLEQYRARRDRTPAEADAQWKLALWCEQNGLEAEARAHLTRATRIEPDHAAARKRLGYKKQSGRWVTDAQLAEEKAEAEIQKQADRAWKPRLEKWRAMLAGKDEARRAEAKRALLEVTDPRAVPAIWAVFGHGSAARQTVAVQLLGQIDGPAASRALTTLAVLSPAAEVRQIAIQTLARRDPRDFVGLLVGRLRDPIKYEVRPVGGPGSPGVLFVEGKRYDVRRSYGTPDAHPLKDLPRYFTPDIPFDPFSPHNVLTSLPALPTMGLAPSAFPGAPPLTRGISYLDVFHHQVWSDSNMPMGELTAQDLQGIASNPRDAPAILAQRRGSQGAADRDLIELNRAAIAMAAARDLQLGRVAVDIQLATLEAQRRLSNDVRALEQANSSIDQMNSRLLPLLEGVTGQRLGEDSEAWQSWWLNQVGFLKKPSESKYKPVLDQFVEVPFFGAEVIYSCFGAGTPVHTRVGRVPIESVKVGDQVLAQDVRTGALGYQPVLAVFRNPPTAPLKVTLGDEAIVATGVHRFWRAGHGWVMARDLKIGDTLRTLGGVARVAAVEPQGTQPVFNLEVAGHNTFFAGRQGALVHDNNLVGSTPEPFDAAPDLAAVIPSRSAR